MAKTVFASIKTKTKYSQIIEQILELIRKGIYKPGDKLPNERLMAEEMDVSRGALRESLKALIILGVIESRQGDGTYVSSKGVGPNHAFIVIENPSVRRLVQLRRLIEIGCAAEGVEAATGKDILRLEKRLEKMQAARRDEDHEAYLQASRGFHADLAKVLVKEHNETLQNLMDELWRATNLAISREIYSDYMGGRLSEYLSTHRQIIAGLRDRSFETVKAAINAHYESILRQLT